MRQLLHQQGAAHSQSYNADPSAYLFALNTYIALLAKLVAASALPNASQDIHDASVLIAKRVAALESGALFEHAGVVNMLNGDFFSWYRDDSAWATFSPVINALVARLTGISYDVQKKSPASTRDLFKGIYETFVPRALRHALGEFYTPDWLAEFGLNTLNWQPDDDLLDPTCGSGTFVLEALRRRLADGHPRTAHKLLDGLYGFDLNPLAVLTAKGSLAVYVAPYLDSDNPVRLSIYLADAINPASQEIDGSYAHVLQTEVGVKSFRLPQKVIVRSDFSDFSLI
ncbi:MAG: N-6 DNA methylase [Gammaproteobacteria bacterium]|nr:N-6 DNA methylase [Gammaproteobacteria bacterium]